MKKFFTPLCALSLILASATCLMAGAVDNKQNYSAEYIRTFNRASATDAIDAVGYNPAGVMKMENGGYANMSFQYVAKEYINYLDGVEHKQDEPSVVPGFFGLYKQDKWAVFASLTVPAGGGKVDYKNGDARTRIGALYLRNNILPAGVYGPIVNERAQGESAYHGITIGGAYKINDTFSLSLGMRYIDAQKEGRFAFQIQPLAIGPPTQSVVLDYEEAANGWGGIFGVNISPKGPFNIGFRYETRTKLDFTYHVKEDKPGLGAAQGVVDGGRHRRDLPGLLGLGVGYRISPKLKLDTSLTWYFQEDANWNGDETKVDDAYEIGFAFEYLFNDKLKGSAGYLYSHTGIETQYMIYESPELEAHSFCCGFAYKFNPRIELNLGVAHVTYPSDSYIDTSSGTALSIDYDKTVNLVALGLQYKFR